MVALLFGFELRHRIAQIRLRVTAFRAQRTELQSSSKGENLSPVRYDVDPFNYGRKIAFAAARLRETQDCQIVLEPFPHLAVLYKTPRNSTTHARFRIPPATLRLTDIARKPIG